MARLRVPAAIFAILVVVVFALLPPRARRTGAPPVSVVRGAFHIHSNRSDGSGTVDDIATAASRAGLQFVILTDHGDGTRAPDPPAYQHGVLILDGLEVSTDDGHYAAFDMAPSPYPLAGTADAVVEDVARLGGFGIAAHPGSPRASLAWGDWDTAFDGLEWINSDSEWRDEARLPIVRALTTYFFRGPESMGLLLDRPASVLQHWDNVAQHRRVVGIAGADAHARLGFQQRTDPDMSRLHVPLPGYESSFRTFTNHVALDSPFRGDAKSDAQRLVDAIRRGHLYSVVDALATPGSLSFTATSGATRAQMGDALTIEGDVVLHAAVSAPPGTTLVLLKNGQRIHEVTDGPLETNGGPDRAAYRIEAYVSADTTVPWIVSNPIYAGLSPPSIAKAAPPMSRIPARVSEAATESGTSDTSKIEVVQLQDAPARTFAGDPAIRWSYALASGTAAGQFAAVPIPISGGLAAFDRIQFRVTANRPMRAWVQVREASGNSARWGATFYADQNSRLVDLPFSKFRAITTGASGQPPLDRVQYVLFVIDTLNTLPGTAGELTISEAAFVK